MVEKTKYIAYLSKESSNFTINYTNFSKKLNIHKLSTKDKNNITEKISNYLRKIINIKHPTKQNIWCTDISRNKFVIHIENKWLIDHNGDKFRELIESNIINPIVAQCNISINDYKQLLNSTNEKEITEKIVNLENLVKLLSNKRQIQQILNNIKGDLKFDEDKFSKSRKEEAKNHIFNQ